MTGLPTGIGQRPDSSTTLELVNGKISATLLPMTQKGAKPYHHGSLRAEVIAAAVAEVEAVGAAGVSLREIARRAGVSHAAPVHHFGDKTGLFTAIATEGFRLATEAIAPAAVGPYGFLDGG